MGKKVHNINVKVDDEEERIIKEIAEVRHDNNKSKAVRDAIRIARVLFHENLTLEKLIKDSLMEQVVENEAFRKDVPLKDLIKNIPELEERVGL